jgi:hypothetical protein
MRLVGFSVSRSEPAGQTSQRDASTKPFTQRSRERELNERSIDLCRRLENVGIARKEALDGTARARHIDNSIKERPS